MNSTSQNYLLNLNNQQKEAVIHTDGPLLILAGAGSGKTKVLTTRVAHLIETRKCWASQILCVTFTNKAANEMRERILKILSAQSSSLPWLGTFHSISNKILRRHAEAVGLKSNSMVFILILKLETVILNHVRICLPLGSINLLKLEVHFKVIWINILFIYKSLVES